MAGSVISGFLSLVIYAIDVNYAGWFNGLFLTSGGAWNWKTP